MCGDAAFEDYSVQRLIRRQLRKDYVLEKLDKRGPQCSYSRIKGTNRTGATAVVVVVPSARLAKTMSS